MLRCFDHEEVLEAAQELWMNVSKVLSLAPVVLEIVELPDVVLEPPLTRRDHLPRCPMPGHRHPSLVVDAAVPAHLEVLRPAALGGFGSRDRVRHTHALDWLLSHA